MTNPPYTYRDFVTGKTRRTWGRFEQWSEPTGPLNVRYAIFKTPKTRVCVPHYCLTKETLCRIALQREANRLLGKEAKE